MEFEGFPALKIPLRPQYMLANTGIARLYLHPTSNIFEGSRTNESFFIFRKSKNVEPA